MKTWRELAMANQLLEEVADHLNGGGRVLYDVHVLGHKVRDYVRGLRGER